MHPQAYKLKHKILDLKQRAAWVQLMTESSGEGSTLYVLDTDLQESILSNLDSLLRMQS